MSNISRRHFVRVGAAALFGTGMALSGCGGGASTDTEEAAETEATSSDTVDEEPAPEPEEAGVWVIVEETETSTMTSPDGSEMELTGTMIYTRDERGNLLEIPPTRFEGGNGGSTRSGSTYTFDENGWYTGVVSLDLAPEGDSVEQGPATTYDNEYDDEGRLVARTVTHEEYPATRLTFTYGAQGYFASITNESEQDRTVVEFDDNGYETHRSVEPFGDSEESPTDISISYEWDDEGHPVKATATRDAGATTVNEYVTDENGNITSCVVTFVNEDGSETSMSWRHEYTYAYVEDPSLAVRVLANEHDFFYM